MIKKLQIKQLTLLQRKDLIQHMEQDHLREQFKLNLKIHLLKRFLMETSKKEQQ